MDEIDLFLQLIDNHEASKILKAFNENTRSDDIEFKRMKLRGILKNQTLKLKTSKRGSQQAPFEFIIFKYEIPFLRDLTEREFFFLLNDKKTKQMPDHVKFANMLICFPEKAPELLPVLEKNLEENKQLFELGYRIDSEEEMKNYYVKTAIYSNKVFIQRTIEDLRKYASQEEYGKVIPEKGKIQHWSFIDYFNEIENYDGYIHLIQMEYLIANPDLELKVKQYFLTDIALALIRNKQKELNGAYKKIAELKASINNNSEQKIDEYKDRVSELTGTISDLNEDIKAGKDEIKSLRIEKEKADTELNNLRKAMEKEKQKYEGELNSIKNSYENKVNKLINEKKEYAEKISKMESYWKYTFASNNDKEYLFAVIHSLGHIQATKMIYPEVGFIPAENWKSSLHGNIIKKIKMIVVQREGVSTNEIIQIEQIARENGINVKIEYIGNEKKLIETIANIKNCEFGGLTNDNTFFA